MIRYHTCQLQAWNKASRATSHVYRPEKIAQLREILEIADKPLISFGLGRSYGDVALNSSGSTILMQRLNKFLFFDENTRELICEPGVTIHEIQQLFLPRHLFLPVSPGTAFVSLGGAIANDIHGKNHDKFGSISQHVNWLELLTANNELRVVSPSQHPELFFATLGGLGLTGFITKISLTLLPASQQVSVIKKKIPDLDTYIRELTDSRQLFDYSVGWIDGQAKKNKLGRGILMLANHVDSNEQLTDTTKGFTLPMNLPSGVLNRLTVQTFNHLYYHLSARSGFPTVLNLLDFLYPLDKIKNWNKLYGSSGFYQFQCVFPEKSARQGLIELMEKIATSGTASFLSVLKTLGGDGRGCLSFPMRGFTLAMDFPNRPGISTLLQNLENITLKNAGRIYLAKDAFLSADSFAIMYPKLAQFKEALRKHDPNGVFQSDLSRRLRIR